MNSELQPLPPLLLQLAPRDQPVPPVWGEHAETSPLDIVVFSKDRAAQLDALLRSLRAFFGFPHRLHVAYITSSDEFELGYDRLRRWHRGVHWVTDEGMFGNVTKNLVREIGEGPGRYLMFLVDDLLFTRPFTAEPLMRSLDVDEQILALSLRLGENITYSYLHDHPTQPPDFSQGYRWAWQEASQGYWNYPMSLDGHIFRTSDVTALLPKLNFSSPNALESAMAGQPFARPLLVCEANPSVVNVSVNRVQTQFENRSGTQHVLCLNQAFLAGRAIDVQPFAGRLFSSCHVDEPLSLITDERDPEPAGWERIQRDSRDYLRIDLREIPTFILNCTEDRQKRLLMEEQMVELGMNYEFVRTMRVTPGWIGVALGHLKVLRLSRARPPFLVLEDDCVFNEDFQPVIEIPAAADCLYLSASLYGLEKPGQVSNGRVGRVLWSKHDASYLRVYNMLARHALLYLNSDFQQAVIASQLEALTNRHLAHPGDVGLAMLQPAHTALLTERSMCRQVNRNVTGGSLAELLPDNEWAEGRSIDTDPQISAEQIVQATRPVSAGLISHKYRFVYFQIGKNASSTLKAELNKPRYACEPFAFNAFDDATLNGYFKFAFLRDPVSRLVSAYQEVSMRHELQDSTVRDKPFMHMEDSPGRFAAFLDQVEKDKWDRHVLTQRSLLGEVRMDFYGRVESFASDLQTVFTRLGLGRCPDLPRRRSRSSRQTRSGYERFNIDHHQLPPHQISRIRAIYQEDVNLVQACCPVPPLQGCISSSSQARALDILKTEDPASVELFNRVNDQHEECFVYVFGNRGFFAEVSTVVRTMIYCWAHGYRLLLDSADSRWAFQLGWADYFEPFCASSAEVAAGTIVRHFDFDCPQDLATRKSLFAFMPEEITFGRRQIRGFHNIMAFFTAMVFRPTRACLTHIDCLKATLELTEPYDAIHLRRGDKVGDEDIFYPAETYLQQLGKIPQHQTLFVMSDDWAAVQEVRDYLQGRGENVPLATLAQPERSGFDVGELRQGLPFMGQRKEAAKEQPYREYVRDQVRTLIAETLIAAGSARFVSTRRSNVGLMTWYLHKNPCQCVLFQPTRQTQTAKPGEEPFASENEPGPKDAGSYYQGTLHLRGGVLHELEIPANSACLESLRGLLSGGRSARDGKLFQVPLQQGRFVLTFSGADVRFIKLDATAVPVSSQQPLPHTHEGQPGGNLLSPQAPAGEFGTQHGNPATYAPELWQWAIDTLGIKSVLDVGCGEGHAAAFFRGRGCTVLGVDGSGQAECDSAVAGLHHRHDYSMGPFVPPGSWDLILGCEFVEHVEERYTHNFLATFTCARKYLLMTFAPPVQSGRPHLNCQPQAYWVNKISRLGLNFDEDLTRQARAVARTGPFQQRGLVFVRAEPLQSTSNNAGEPSNAVGSASGGDDADEVRAFKPALTINSMLIGSQGSHEFFLFLDIFVHPTRNKIVAILPYYNEDWNLAEQGIDLEQIILVYRNRRIRGRYIPHRLDSWEPCALLDFEDPILQKSLLQSRIVRFTIEAGPQVRTFELETSPVPACNVLMSLVIRNENRWLRHFLEYYLNCLGADHVLVYDNGTADQQTLMQLLGPYQDAGKVTYIPWNFRWRNLREPHKMIAQPQQEAHSLNRFANSRWIGFFDTDEFLRLPDTTLPQFLAAFEATDIDGLSFGLRWYQYEGELGFEEIADAPLTFFKARRCNLGRKRQKLLVAPARIRFMRIHSLQEGGRELQIDDTDIYFHHYCQRADRFKNKTGMECCYDDYMVRFANQLALDEPLRG